MPLRLLPSLSRIPGLLAGLWLLVAVAHAQTYPFSWTVLTPENDSRAADVREQDIFDSHVLVASMNKTEPVFHQQLAWRQVALKDLLSVSAPFCEMRFDAVSPLVLTDQEKAVMREYFMRGGFILFQEDAYPYTQDEFWSVKSWPVIDFLRQELPASSADFQVQRITDTHPIFHQYYQTQTGEMIRHELLDNPYTPNRTLLTYRGHACAFVFGRYTVVEDGKWVATPRPFERIFSLDRRGYELTVNLYVYSTLP